MTGKIGPYLEAVNEEHPELFSSFGANRQLAERLCGPGLSVAKVLSTESALFMASLEKGVTILPRNSGSGDTSNLLHINITTPGCLFETYVYNNANRMNPSAGIMLEELESRPQSNSGFRKVRL